MEVNVGEQYVAINSGQEVEVVMIGEHREIVYRFDDLSLDLLQENDFLNYYRLKTEPVTGWVRVVYDEDFGATYFTDTIHVTKQNAISEFEDNFEGVFDGLELLDVIEINWNGVTSKS